MDCQQYDRIKKPQYVASGWIKRCSVENCVKRASCNRPGLRHGMVCYEHKQPDMVVCIR